MQREKIRGYGPRIDFFWGFADPQKTPLPPLATRRGSHERGPSRRFTKTVASPGRGAEPPRAMHPVETQGETMQSMTSTASSASAAARLAEARYHAKYDPAKVVVVADYRDSGTVRGAGGTGGGAPRGA